MLSREDVSSCFLEKNIFQESAKQGARFLLGLYKNEVCFFISSFLAGKEAKEAGGTYDGSPLTPFQRPTGALPLSVDPAQWDECPLLAGFCRKSTARAKSERRQRAEGATRGRGMAEYKNFGRKRERLPAAHRRAALGMNCAGQISRFLSSGSAGIG